MICTCHVKRWHLGTVSQTDWICKLLVCLQCIFLHLWLRKSISCFRLSGCLITHEGCSLLSSALKSNPSYLKQLDLSYNHPGDSGVRELTDRLNDPSCKLETLRWDVLHLRCLCSGAVHPFVSCVGELSVWRLDILSRFQMIPFHILNWAWCGPLSTASKRQSPRLTHTYEACEQFALYLKQVLEFITQDGQPCLPRLQKMIRHSLYSDPLMGEEQTKLWTVGR